MMEEKYDSFENIYLLYNFWIGLDVGKYYYRRSDTSTQMDPLLSSTY